MSKQELADAQLKDKLEQYQLLLDLMRESCRPSPYFKVWAGERSR